MPKAITQFDEIYAVGDSMSDNGGIFQLSSDLLDLVAMAGIPTGGLQPVPITPPYDERFSNGPVLPEYTAALLGATLQDFAFGAAPAVGSLTFGNLVQTVIPPDLYLAIQAVPGVPEILNQVISLPGQLEDLSAALTANPPADNSALVSLIGLNDFLSLVGSVNPNDPASIAAAIAEAQNLIPQIIAANHTAATTAFGLGIDTVIYETLPAASFFPVTPTALEVPGDAAIAAINAGLVNDAHLLQQDGFDVRIVDTAFMAHEIAIDPGTFGFLNFEVPFSSGNGITFVPNLLPEQLETTAFFDPLHPTTNLHGVLGVFAAESLTSNVIFGAGIDVITGSDGDDLVLAGAENDTVQLGEGNDIVLAGLGNDTATGGQGSDLMSGGSGNDNLSGNNGQDVVVGNAGNDLLNGDNGNDVLIDGLGSDVANGGNGNDLFLASQPQLLGGDPTLDVDLFNGGAGDDTVVVRLAPNALQNEQTNVHDNFHAGQSFTFASLNLTITGIEHIVLTTDPLLTEVNVTGDLAARLHEADLFGFV
jgi:Ca2+-binding RTX toxin-like protein